MNYPSKQQLVRLALVIALAIILIQNFPEEIARHLFTFFVVLAIFPQVIFMFSTFFGLYFVAGHALSFLKMGYSHEFFSAQNIVLKAKLNDESINSFLTDWKGVELILTSVYPPVWLLVISVICFFWHKAQIQLFKKYIEPKVDSTFKKVWAFVVGDK